MSRIGTGIAIAFLSVALAATAQAEEYPSRPVHLVVPYSAGGGTDVVGRVIVDKLAERLGNPSSLKTNRAPAHASASTMSRRSRPMVIRS